MGNDDGLDLGLGLSCGGSSSKSYTRADNHTNNEDKTSNISDGSRSLHHVALHIEDMENKSLRTSEKFFHMVSGDGNRLVEVEENLLDASNKRKSFFEDLKHQKKHEYGANDDGLHEKTKTSHISITTADEGSTADNKDVVNSEIDGLMSRFVADHDSYTKQQSEGDSSGSQKQTHGHNNSGVGQMSFSDTSESGPKTWINMYKAQYGAHTLNITKNTPVSSSSMESGSATMPRHLGHPLHRTIQMRRNASWDQPVTPGNISMAFDCAPVQSQPLGKEQLWSMLPHPQHLYPPFAFRPTLGEFAGSEKHTDALKLPQGFGQVHHFNTLESSIQDRTGIQLAKGAGKQHLAEQVPTFSCVFATLTPPDSISSIDSAITPGIAADLKFAGTGSYPNLPWVSANGSGPNGKTISGVTYRFSPNQIKIVCACHGSHMTPDEFVRHADDENSSLADMSTSKPSLPSNNNPETSAQS